MKAKFVVLFLAFVLGSCGVQKKMVILGSSTAQGFGASVPDSSWARRLATYYGKRVKIVNLAKGGYTTYHMLATGKANPAGRPAVDTMRNITAALKEHPNYLILSMTTNDVAAGFGVEEYLSNIEEVRLIALANGIKRVWVTTPTPRNLPTEERRKLLKEIRARLLQKYGKDGIDIYGILEGDDYKLSKTYDSKDGIHSNDAGHRLLFLKIKDGVGL